MRISLVRVLVICKPNDRPSAARVLLRVGWKGCSAAPAVGSQYSRPPDSPYPLHSERDRRAKAYQRAEASEGARAVAARHGEQHTARCTESCIGDCEKS